jgi:hypothetical protein
MVGFTRAEVYEAVFTTATIIFGLGITLASLIDWLCDAEEYCAIVRPIASGLLSLAERLLVLLLTLFLGG